MTAIVNILPRGTSGVLAVTTATPVVIAPAVPYMVPVLLSVILRRVGVGGGAFSKISTSGGRNVLMMTVLATGDPPFRSPDSLPVYGDVGEALQFTRVEAVGGTVHVFYSYGYVSG